MTTDMVINLLGLAYRAVKTICGAAAAEQQIKKKSACLLFLAGDCGATNEERYLRLSTQNRIKVIRTYSKEELGRALGRSQTAIVVLTDKGFAEAVSKAVQKMD